MTDQTQANTEEAGRNNALVMRKVQVFKQVIRTERRLGELRVCEELVDDGFAVFHAWGVDYKEVDGSAGNYSTAIVERDDGSVQNIPVKYIKFVDA